MKTVFPKIPLRKKLFDGSDGIIFVADGEASRFEENLNSLRELKGLAGERLINEIPLVFIINIREVAENSPKSAFKAALKQEEVWYGASHNLGKWNPKIYETLISYDNHKPIYECFSECTRRVVLYTIHGDGKAPDLDDNDKQEKGSKHLEASIKDEL